MKKPTKPLMRHGYAEIRAASAGTSAELWIYGDIGEKWWDEEESITAKKITNQLAKMDTDEIVVRINSFGGAVTDALAIYNALRRHDAHIAVEIDGVAMSAASLIAMAGDNVGMAANALLMIHAPWSAAAGNAEELRGMADVLDKYAHAMATSYARNDFTESEALALLTDGEDHFYTAEEAESTGLIDTISEALPIAATADQRALAVGKYRIPKTYDFISAAAVASTGADHMSDKSTKKPAASQDPATTIPETLDNQKKVEAAAEKRAQELVTAHQVALDTAFAPMMVKNYPHQAIVTAEVSAARGDLTKTVDQVRATILDKIGAEHAQPAFGATHTRATAGEDQRDKTRSASVNWLMARVGMRTIRQDDGTDRALDLSGNPFRGHTLLDMARACLRSAGKKHEGMDKRELVAAAFQTTSDFPTLFENLMHKVLLNAYRLAPDTWSRFCKTGSVSDFRAHNRYRVGSIGNYDALNEHGEYVRKTIPDGEKASITATTRGNIIGVTREVIINDDLGAMTDLAMSLGRAGRRTIEAAVYASLAENSGGGPTLSDGVAMFHADHGNLEATTVGAPSVATFEASRVLMASQMDVGGNDYLDLRPSSWLGPIGLGGTARVVNDAQYDPDTANRLQRPNMVRGLVADVIDTPRLSGAPWYLFADPNEAPVLEVAFLDGMQEPYTETQNGWDVDGAEIKARLDFGVAGIDYRGAVKNAGA